MSIFVLFHITYCIFNAHIEINVNLLFIYKYFISICDFFLYVLNVYINMYVYINIYIFYIFEKYCQNTFINIRYFSVCFYMCFRCDSY